MARLVYEHEGEQHEIRLGDEPVSLGRSDEADRKLPTKLASRIHAQVMPRGSEWWVEDLQSSNGTLVNGRKIDRPAQLAHGDVIILGDIKLKFEGAPPPAGPPDHLLARLLYHPEDGQAPIELIVRDRVTIGRKAGNTLQIDSKAVSGHHAEVLNRGGVYVLRDLGSSNGTYVEKKAVTEHTLRSGESILLGKIVPVYFVDPSGQAPVQAAPPAAQPVPEASTSPTASDRGVFEPVAAAPMPAPRSNLVPAVITGVVLAGLLLFAGWAVGEVVHGFRMPRQQTQQARVPELALADAAFSFEGEIDDGGNPEGWIATCEAAGGAKAELASDPADPYDGQRSLRVGAKNLSGTATLVLTTQKARPIELGGGCRVSMYLRGEGADRIAVALSVLGETGRAHTVATGAATGLTSEWTLFETQGVIVGNLPQSGQYRLLICGAFSRLWIDRIEIRGGEGSRPAVFRKLEGAEVSLSLDKTEPATAYVANDRHRAVFTPRVLASNDDVLSEAGLWSVTGVDAERVVYSSMHPRRADAVPAELAVEPRSPGYFEGEGVELRWNAELRTKEDSLAVEIELPLPEGATVAIADRLGAPLEVSREVLHTYAYSTVRELMVNETGLSVNFPDGAVVWFDMSKPGRLIAVARAAVSGGRKSMRVRVFTRPLMFARLYEKLYDEALRLWEVEHGSAAKARLKYLLGPIPHRELAVVGKARDKLVELETARQDLLKAIDDAMAAAEKTLSEQTVLVAERSVRRYLATWRGEEDADEVERKYTKIDIWRGELEALKRTPEEKKQAEAIAQSLWAGAESKYEAGDLLASLMLVENLVKVYAGTSVHRKAVVLYEEIQQKMSDPVARDQAIDKELAGIDEDIKFKDYKRARDRCIALFKRFPDTPRNRDIMKRLRKVEEAFGG